MCLCWNVCIASPVLQSHIFLNDQRLNTYCLYIHAPCSAHASPSTTISRTHRRFQLARHSGVLLIQTHSMPS